MFPPFPVRYRPPPPKYHPYSVNPSHRWEERRYVPGPHNDWGRNVDYSGHSYLSRDEERDRQHEPRFAGHPNEGGQAVHEWNRDLTEKQIAIRDDIIPFIMETSGRGIRFIEEQSGANIKLVVLTSEPSVFTIKGNSIQIDCAENLLKKLAEKAALKMELPDKIPPLTNHGHHALQLLAQLKEIICKIENERNVLHQKLEDVWKVCQNELDAQSDTLKKIQGIIFQEKEDLASWSEEKFEKIQTFYEESLPVKVTETPNVPAGFN